MNTSIAHLPKHKRAQLQRIVQSAMEATTPEMIILFGSHATGKWVEDIRKEGHILTEYISDYDILVITAAEVNESEVEEYIEARCNFHTPVTVIVHDIAFVNKMLGEGQYFFSDIKKEGIALYDTGDITLADQQPLTSEERWQIALDDYEYWFSEAKIFLETAASNAGKKYLKNAAFQLHQAAERTFTAAALVFTGYKPRTHNLEKLLNLSWTYSRDLGAVFIPHSDRDKYLFKLLKKAYIEARYKKSYKITEEELSALIEKVTIFQQTAQRLCEQQLASYKGMG